MKSSLRLSSLLIPLFSCGAFASTPFYVLYEQHPLPDAQVESLSGLLERKIKQVNIGSSKEVEAYILSDQADLLLTSKNVYRNLTPTYSLSLESQFDWAIENWQFVDSHTLSTQHFYPYTVDFTSLAINADMLPASMITTWSDAWDSQWSDQIAVTKDYQSLFVVAMNMLGYQASTSNSVEIHSAYKLLESWLPNIHEISSTNEIEMAFLSGEVVIGMSTSSGVYSVAQEGSAMKMLWDLDPIIKTTYGFSVPKSSSDSIDSVKAIEWLVNGENAAQFALENERVSAIRDTNALLPHEYVTDPNLYPPQDMEPVYRNANEYAGQTELYKEYFDELCAKHDSLAF
jgi:spermidine/putrescine-binding protein